MKCPKCNNEMKVIKNDISNNAKQGSERKDYNRTIYWCETDDIWINIEVPK